VAAAAIGSMFQMRIRWRAPSWSRRFTEHWDRRLGTSRLLDGIMM
jgi:hypothetical protein